MSRTSLRAPICLAAAVLFMLATAASAYASASGIVISEFRFRGPTGGNDEYVELLNTSANPVDVTGWGLQGCASTTGNPSTRATILSPTVLAPGQHLLFTNAGFSGAAGDRSYSTGISDNAGARIVTDAGAVVDGVAAEAGPAAPCREGTGLAIPTTNGDNSFERHAGGTQDTDDNAADFAGPKPGDPRGTSGPTGPLAVKIHEIQGAGRESPLLGRTVVVQGIVTGVDDEVGISTTSGRTFAQDAGIFVQEEPADEDGDRATSEGIFVGFVDTRTELPLGSVVRLEGRVAEQFGLTMISETRNTEPVITGAGSLPAPVDISTAQAEAQNEGTKAYYETLEGMRVRIPITVANSGGTNKFGELFLTPGAAVDRVFRTEAAPSLIATDADAGAGNPANPLRDADGSTSVVNADLFDTVADVVGPLAFSFSHFKVMVQPARMPLVTKGPTTYPYDRLAPATAYQLRIASFNVENFFPVGGSLDLGTVSEEEYAEKKARIADAIDRLLLRPDIVAVQEVVDRAILEDLAAELGGYRAFLVDGNDNRGIDNGFLVKKTIPVANVRQLGKDVAAPAGLDCSDVEGRLFDRPPLALDVLGPIRVTVFSNHFASKGSAVDACRDAQAAFVRDRVAAIEATGRNAIVAGDINAFEDEQTLAVFEEGTTLTNLWSQAPAEERYSSAFQGKLQTLDHILVTDGLDARVADFRYAHFDNDYFDRNEPTDGHKVSDHDPPVLTLSIPPAATPVGGR